MKITFLGTNGWYATNTGNTVCTLIDTPERYIVLDAGDGIYRLDEYAKDKSKPVDIFISHFHLDHVFGLHIQPRFHFKNKIRIFVQKNTSNIIRTIINKPFTAPPELLEKIGLDVSVHELNLGKNNIDEYIVHTAPLVHADPCWGFRFEIPTNKEKEKKIISYCTDTGPCENIISLSKNADVFITECGLLPGEEIPKEWPHLNPETAAEIAKKSNCKKLFLTHFGAHKYVNMKLRDDAQKIARKIFENSFSAKDEMEIIV
ncbi:MAG: ribonuclease Z [Candidatus Micrarchaeota archaeon]